MKKLADRAGLTLSSRSLGYCDANQYRDQHDTQNIQLAYMIAKFRSTDTERRRSAAPAGRAGQSHRRTGGWCRSV